MAGAITQTDRADTWPHRWWWCHWVRASLLLLWFGDGHVISMVAAAEDASHGTAEVTFENDIEPLLTRFGCNSGPCHGKSRGQNGFALSLLGFDSAFDYAALTREARGRRLFPAAPASSLLLLKATAQVPHGGGKRFDTDSRPYELLTRWIQDGAPNTPPDTPQLISVDVEPARLSLTPAAQMTLHVRASYSDGSKRDVTPTAAFQSNDQTVAAVNPDGGITAGALPGETAIMCRYMNHIAVCVVAIPLAGQVDDTQYAALPVHNPIDTLVYQKLKTLGMLPSATSRDAEFLRRAYLRAIGRLPSSAEARAFLADERVDKRQRLIDQLLEQPEYADFWANKWADLLRPNPYRVGIKAVWMLDAWLRAAFRENRPYDQWVRELLTAQGSTFRNGATVVFRDRPETVELAASVSQLFLGVRLECAKCHHHPFEVWSQDDFYGFAAFFARVGHQGGLSPPISGTEELIYVARSGQMVHGRTGQVVPPKTLQGAPQEIVATDDPRRVLANWMTDPDNPYFAHVMVNRVWADLMGVGLVEPIDDFRATNPCSNPPLLSFLAQRFRESGYDIKQLIRLIMSAHVFELSAEPNERNGLDTRNFARYYRQRMRAEVLLDAVNDVLETSETFAAMPAGARATQVWTYRSESTFLDTFGRPDPNQDPPCDRSFESTTPQVLHLMNSPDLNGKLSNDHAAPAKLAAAGLTDTELVDELYLRFYSRRPSDDEANVALKLLQADPTQRRQFVEDLCWALLNTPEFMFIN